MRARKKGTTGRRLLRPKPDDLAAVLRASERYIQFGHFAPSLFR